MKAFMRFPMPEARFWERDPHILCRLVPYLGGMDTLWSYDISAFLLPSRRRAVSR
jgi:hypothetical protein